MASHTAAQSQTDTVGDIACDHKHAADRAGKSVHSVSQCCQSIRPNRVSYENTYRYCRRVGGFRSERQGCGFIAPM